MKFDNSSNETIRLKLDNQKKKIYIYTNILHGIVKKNTHTHTNTSFFNHLKKCTIKKKKKVNKNKSPVRRIL